MRLTAVPTTRCLAVLKGRIVAVAGHLPYSHDGADRAVRRPATETAVLVDRTRREHKREEVFLVEKEHRRRQQRHLPYNHVMPQQLRVQTHVDFGSSCDMLSSRAAASRSQRSSWHFSISVARCSSISWPDRRATRSLPSFAPVQVKRVRSRTYILCACRCSMV